MGKKESLLMETRELKLLESLLATGKLNDWEAKAFKDIYDRNPGALSVKQKTMFERAEIKYITRKHRHPIKVRTKVCSIEEFPDGWKIADNKGNIYGKGMSKKDASQVMEWFTDVLNGVVQKPGSNGTTPIAPTTTTTETTTNKTSPF